MFVLISLLAKHFLYSFLVVHEFFNLEVKLFSFHGHRRKNIVQKTKSMNRTYNAISINSNDFEKELIIENHLE